MLNKTLMNGYIPEKWFHTWVSFYNVYEDVPMMLLIKIVLRSATFLTLVQREERKGRDRKKEIEIERERR